jgi:hypothetical protein
MTQYLNRSFTVVPNGPAPYWPKCGRRPSETGLLSGQYSTALSLEPSNPPCTYEMGHRGKHSWE